MSARKSASELEQYDLPAAAVLNYVLNVQVNIPLRYKAASKTFQIPVMWLQDRGLQNLHSKNVDFRIGYRSLVNGQIKPEWPRLQFLLHTEESLVDWLNDLHGVQLQVLFSR